MEILFIYRKKVIKDGKLPQIWPVLIKNVEKFN